MPRRATRATEIGVSAAKYAAKAQRFIESTREKAQQLSYEWAEVDPTVCGAVDALLAQLDEFQKTVNDGVAYLKEIPGESQ